MSEHVTLDRENLLRLVEVLRASTAGIDMPDAMRAGQRMTLEGIEEIAAMMPTLYGSEGCPNIPALLERLEAAEAKVARVEALAKELDHLSRSLHRGEQGPVQAGEASGLGIAAHRLRAALSDEERP